MEDLLAQSPFGTARRQRLLEHVISVTLSGGSEGTINDSSMQAASLIKLYIMGAVYENYDSLSQQYGAQTTLNAYLQPMITVSDNDAANSLVSAALEVVTASAGMQKVNSFCTDTRLHQYLHGTASSCQQRIRG